MDAKFVNVLILGVGFMFVFTAFQTMGNIEKTILDSISEEKPDFTGDGYISLAIIYAFFAACNWLAPSFMSCTGPRTAMVCGSIIYTAFILMFLYPITWLLYLMSAALGAGASIIWTGQGTLLSRCSNASNISRNSAIFWALLQCSMFFGNLFVYYQFQDKSHIDKDTRTLVIAGLTVVSVLGIIFLTCLRHIDENEGPDPELQQRHTGLQSAVFALKAAGRLFVTRDMLLLSLSFLYTGFELSFLSGVYGSSIGFSSKISATPKEIVGLSGICVGAGEVFGGGLFGILGGKTTRFGRDPIFILGYVVHIVSYLLIFLNLPDNSPFGNTEDIGYLDPPRPWIALLCAFFLGFGDACFNTQCYSMLGGEFKNNSVGAFALFKFTQSVGAAATFIYSSHVSLKFQLLILVIFGTLGTMCFCMVEWSIKRRTKVTEISD